MSRVRLPPRFGGLALRPLLPDIVPIAHASSVLESSRLLPLFSVQLSAESALLAASFVSCLASRVLSVGPAADIFKIAAAESKPHRTQKRCTHALEEVQFKALCNVQTGDRLSVLRSSQAPFAFSWVDAIPPGPGCDPLPAFVWATGAHASFVPVVSDMLGAFGESTKKWTTTIASLIAQEVGIHSSWAATLVRLLLANAVGIATARLIVDARRRILWQDPSSDMCSLSVESNALSATPITASDSSPGSPLEQCDSFAIIQDAVESVVVGCG